MSLDNAAKRSLAEISRIASVDRTVQRPAWVHLSRDIYVSNLIHRWLSKSAGTPWETVESQQEMQALMQAVQAILPKDDGKLALNFFDACMVPLAAAFTPMQVVEGEAVVDPRIGPTLSSLSSFCERAEAYGAGAGDVPLRTAAIAYMTARQSIWLRRVSGISWSGSRTAELATPILGTVFHQYLQRKVIAQQYTRAIAKRRFLSISSPQDARLLSVFDEIHGPDVDLFGAVSAAYAELYASGELGEPGEGQPSDMPSIDRDEGAVEYDDDWEEDAPPLTPDEIEEIDDLTDHGGLPDPDSYGPPEDDMEPLPEKE